MTFHLSYVAYFALFEILVWLTAGKIAEGNEAPGAMMAIMFWFAAHIITIILLALYWFGVRVNITW